MSKSSSPKSRIFFLMWASVVHRFSWLIISCLVIATILTGVFVANNIVINTSTKDMLSSELSFRKLDREMDVAFPDSMNNLLIVVDAQTPDIVDYAGDILADALRQRPDLYGQVYYLPGDPFFRRNGLLYTDLDSLYELSDQLAETQPFLGSLSKDLSLRGLFGILSRVIDFKNDSKSDGLISLDFFLSKAAQVAESQIDGNFSQFSWQNLINSKSKLDEGGRRFILLKPPLNYKSLSPASEVIDSIKILSQRLSLTPNFGITIRLSGSAIIEEEELKSVEQGMGAAVLASLLLVFLLLIIGLKHFQLILATIASLLIGLVLTTGFATAVLGSFNLISIAFAVLFIGLSVDFSIHYSLRFLEVLGLGYDYKKAIVKSGGDIGRAITLTAVCAAISFYSFLPTDYRGLAELGLIAGTGMLIALVITLTVLPVLLTLFPKIDVSNQKVTGLFFPFKEMSFKFAKTTCVIFFFVGVFAVFTIPRVNFDFDPLNLKNQSGKAMATLVELMQDRRITPYSIEVLASDIKQGQAISETLSKLKVVNKVETIFNYIPKDQDEKLEVISSIELFLSPSLAERTVPQNLSQFELESVYDEFETSLSKIDLNWDDKNEKASADRLRLALKKIMKKGGGELKEFEYRMLASLPKQLEYLMGSLKASRITLEHLPPQLKRRNLTVDGRVKVEIFPSDDLRDPKALRTFVDSVRKIIPNAIGTPVIIVEAGKAVMRAFFQAGIISILLISLLLMFFLSRIRDVIIVFLPIVAASILTLATTVLLELSFNFANVIVLPLLFGLGVAGSLHLVIRNQKGNKVNVLSTLTPRAVLFSALTTIFSFGTISFSNHPGTASMGILLTISIFLTLLCTLVFLPAILVMVAPREK